MMLNWKPLMKSCLSFCKQVWKDLSVWNCILSQYCACSIFRTLWIRRPAKTIKELPIEDKERKVSLDLNKGCLKKRLNEIPSDKTLIKQQLSNRKRIFSLYISSGKHKEMAVKKKRKARRTFDKNPFKFTEKLFEQGKNGVLNVAKETLEAHLQRKYSNPLADTPMGDFGELNRLQPLEETFENTLIKLGEAKDLIRKARAKHTPGINGISYKL